MPSQMGRNRTMFHNPAVRQKSVDFSKLPLAKRQNHDVPHSISRVGHWGQSIWNCGIIDGLKPGTVSAKLVNSMLIDLKAATKVPIIKAYNQDWERRKKNV